MNIFQLIPFQGAGCVRDAAERTETREEICSLEDDFQEHPEKERVSSPTIFMNRNNKQTWEGF